MKSVCSPRVVIGPITLSRIQHKRLDVRLSARKQRSQGGKGFGKPSSPADGDSGTVENNEEQGTRPDPPSRDVGSIGENKFISDSPYTSTRSGVKGPESKTTDPSALPVVDRDQIIATCLQTSALIAVMGFGLHQLAPLLSTAARDGNTEALEQLLKWPSLPTAVDIGITATVAGVVTATRLLLLASWPQFKTATDTSNTQVLLPLSSQPLDIAIISILPALAEELLFRGALLPAIYPDWRGVVISGAVFGALHINGGRNLEFGVWAGSVGCAYGAAFLATGNLAVPMAAHAMANIASASLWLISQQSAPSSQDVK